MPTKQGKFVVDYNDTDVGVSVATVLSNLTTITTMQTYTGKIPMLDLDRIIKMVALLVMASLALIGNSTTLWVMWKRRARRSTITTLIINLAVADIFVVFFCMLVDAAWAYSVSWKGGAFLCKFLKFMQVYSLYVSTYILVVISLDRCQAVVYPMSRLKPGKRIKVMLGAVWIGSVLLASPQVNLTQLSVDQT